MYINSDRPGGFGLSDIWIARRARTHDDFGWEEPVNAGPGVNSPFIEAGASYLENDDEGDDDDQGDDDDDEEGTTPLLYFGSTRPGGPGLVDIYVSAQAPDGSWGPAVLVPELSSSSSDQRPSLRTDGLELFLFSNRPGGFGLADLWVSTRRTTRHPWSAPINLGATVNGPAADQQEFISSDRKTLLFASDRPGGSGNLDVYATTREKDDDDDGGNDR